MQTLEDAMIVGVNKCAVWDCGCLRHSYHLSKLHMSGNSDFRLNVGYCRERQYPVTNSKTPSFQSQCYSLCCDRFVLINHHRSVFLSF